MVNDCTLNINRVPAERVSCKRRDVLDKLKEALTALEEPPYVFPLPKANLRGEKCECYQPPQHGKVTYSPTSYLDGAEAIPFKLVDTSTKVQWSPKYCPPTQNPHPTMTCFCVPQVLNPELCECPDGIPGKRERDPNVGKGDKDYCTSGQDVYHCPPSANHHHWSPHKGSCVWPKPCIASCFDHSDKRDWVNLVPNYVSYMETADSQNF